MDGNTLIATVSSAVKVGTKSDAEVVSAFTNMNEMPSLTKRGYICVGLESFEIGEQLTDTVIDESGIIIPGQRQKTGCASVNFYLPNSSKPSDAYALFNKALIGLFSMGNSNQVLHVECLGAEYEKTYNALVLRSKVIMSVIE